MAPDHAELYVLPNGLTNLVVVIYGTSTQIQPYAGTQTFDVVTAGTYTVSADGYQSQDVYMDDYTKTVTLVANLPDNIADAITAAQGRVADCYTAISNKGGTLPATQNLANMPTAIGSITTGGTIDSLTITPTTSQQTITASGGVDGYSPITVNAVTSSIDANITAGNIKSGVSILGVNGSVTELNGSTKTVTPTTSQQTVTPTSPSNGLTSVTVNAVTSSIDANITAGNIKNGVSILGVTGTLQSGYSELPSYQVSNGVASMISKTLDGTEFSSITSIGNSGLENSFYNRTNLKGQLNFSSLTSVGSRGLFQAFYGCYNITSIDLSSLISIDNRGLFSAFESCNKIQSISFTSLTSIGTMGLNYTFGHCHALVNIYFNSLTTSSFGSYTDQFNYMLYGASRNTTHKLHFPSNLETTIQGLDGYPTFGGTSGSITLVFDLPATT